MKFNLKTYTVDDKIFQELESEYEDITTKILRQVYDVKEKQLKDALIKLGWTPPKEPNSKRKYECNCPIWPKCDCIIQGKRSDCADKLS